MVRERIAYLFVYSLRPCELLFFYFRRETFEESQPSFETSHNFWLTGKASLHIEQGQGLQEVLRWAQGPPLGTP